MNTQRMNLLNYYSKIAALSVSISFGIMADANGMPSPKSPATIQLSFYKRPDKSKIAVATATTIGSEGRPLYAPGAKVNFYAMDKSELFIIDSAYTDLEGKARISIPDDLPVDTEGMVILIAKIENDPKYTEAEIELRIKEANLVLSISETDTIKTITAIVTEKAPDGKEIPVNDVEIVFYAQRLFGPMPLTEEATLTSDENGLATFTFPNGIRGDEQGIITLLVRIEDHDKFGNVESSIQTHWGIPLVIKKNPFPSELWEPRAPRWLKVSFVIVFGGIWLTFLFILYQLTKLQKKKSTTIHDV